MDNVAIPQQFWQQRPMPATTNAEKRFTAYVRCQTPEHSVLFEAPSAVVKWATKKPEGRKSGKVTHCKFPFRELSNVHQRKPILTMPDACPAHATVDGRQPVLAPVRELTDIVFRSEIVGVVTCIHKRF